MEQASGHFWTPVERKFTNRKLKVLIEGKIVTMNQIEKKNQCWAVYINGVGPSDHRKQSIQRTLMPNVQTID